MTSAERRLLANLRRSLLQLHKTMLDWERSVYEREHGRVSPGDLLRIVMNDAQFAWLRPISELIVRIDAGVETDAPDTVTDVEAIVTQARNLVGPGFEGNSYSERYRTALQESPDAVLAHREVTRTLEGVKEKTH
jgi:hypothetical protein